jgi:hypothetical protein
MKDIETTFTKNTDGCGDTIFTQVRKEGLNYIYRRQGVGKSMVTYEVFTAKEVLKGSPLPGGGTVAEDYIQYPGKSAFSRSAWSTVKREAADRIFTCLINGEQPFRQSIANLKAASSSSSSNLVKVKKLRKGGRKSTAGEVHEVTFNDRIWKGVLPSLPPVVIPDGEFSGSDFKALNMPNGHADWRLVNELR